MPTYNGGKYLREQLDSIYAQTLLPDEVIVVDDCSTDETISILEEYKEKYGLKFFRNDNNLGYNRNFEKAISLCSGDYIALSDQDDIWLPTKLEKSYCKLLEIENELPALVSSFVSTNKQVLHRIPEKRYIEGGWDLNLNRYVSQGCTLMFNRSLVQYIIPFPDGIMYDAYIGFVASLIGNRYYIGENLMYYRIHNNNSFATSDNSFIERLSNNLHRRIPCWFDNNRYKALLYIKEKYQNLIESEKLEYLNQILYLYETSVLNRIIVFNRIKGIPILNKFKTTVFLIIKFIFRVKDYD